MNHGTKHSATTLRAGGFTLVEVLVAMLVLSIGLLGVAGLQATSMRNNADASMQTRASYIASDMADRMRANSGVASAYLTTSPSAASGSCQSSTCSASEIVENDLAEWNQLLASLPAGQGTISDAGNGLFTITVRWDEARNGASGTGCDPDDSTDLRCLSITTQP
ncbi:MAG: type IV pilus modification protein PilV [Thiogranum sp.]